MRSAQSERGAKVAGWRWLAAALSAALCVSATPPYDLWPAALVGWVPLLVALEGLSRRNALALGLVQGTLINLLSLSWLAGALNEVAGFSLPVAAALCAALSVLQGARSALVAWLVQRAREQGWPLVLAFPAALVLSELFYPMLFPWFTGLFAHAVPAWLQLAEYGGPLAISAWLAAVNACLATLAIELRANSRSDWLRSRRTLLHGMLALTLVAAVSTFGYWRIENVSKTAASAPKLKLGIVQGNFSPTALDRGDPVSVYRELSLAIEQHGSVDLLIWPETAVSYPVPVAQMSALHRDVMTRDRSGGEQSPRVTKPLLSGVVLDASDETHAERAGASRPKAVLRNAAVLFGAEHEVLGTYSKQVLVPIGETTLFPRSWAMLNRLLPPVDDFEPGGPAEPLPFAGKNISLSICYEDLLRSVVRKHVVDTQPDLLVNLTSDAWFGVSRAAELHFALAKFRAVEHRRYFVRATNTGPSAVIDPTGRITWQLPAHARASGVAEARWMRSRTFYERWGDLPLSLAASAGCLLMFGRRRDYFAVRKMQESSEYQRSSGPTASE